MSNNLSKIDKKTPQIEYPAAKLKCVRRNNKELDEILGI